MASDSNIEINECSICLRPISKNRVYNKDLVLHGAGTMCIGCTNEYSKRCGKLDPEKRTPLVCCPHCEHIITANEF